MSAWDHPLDELAELVADIWATPEPASEDTTWADHWAEQRKDEAQMPSFDPHDDDRAADNYYERRWTR